MDYIVISQSIIVLFGYALWYRRQKISNSRNWEFASFHFAIITFVHQET